MSDEMLARLQEHLLAKGVPIPGWRARDEERERFRARAAQGLVELRAGLADDRVSAEAERLAGLMTGVGVLTPLLSEPDVEEIIVRDGHVQLERRGRIEDLGDLASDAHFEGVVRRAADLGGQMLKADQPFVLVDLPTGDRLTAMVPPLSVNGVALNIRVFGRRRLSLDDLQRAGMFDGVATADRRRLTAVIPPCGRPSAVGGPAHPKGILSGNGKPAPTTHFPPSRVGQFLAQVAAGNLATTLISGEFSSGKTTLLNAMSQHFPPTLQLAVVETFQELQLQHPHPARAVVSANGRAGVTMRDVVNVLYTRMRPDAIVIGEIVAGEAVEFLQAINLGKKAYATIHGNSPLDALYHLEDLDLRSGLPLPAIRERIARGIDLVVHLSRTADGGRHVAEIVVVDGLDESGGYRLTPLFQADSSREGRAASLRALWEGLE